MRLGNVDELLQSELIFLDLIRRHCQFPRSFDTKTVLRMSRPVKLRKSPSLEQCMSFQLLPISQDYDE